MGTYGPANEKLRNLEEVEKEIALILQSAGGNGANAILEMSKEKVTERTLDRHASQFTASVQRVEMELSSQIRYLTQVATGQPHEGSSYSARKDAQMAVNRVEYTHLKVRDLARTCDQMLEQP
ncbi:mediator of RNA polymerase II transcription subunit 11 isoform X2 [Hypanus sabinus]|uniref:mediator of RNA polymerase II transcription subunit 11 isoform X2 n=1 Tax=Hypanus sabinus TaxID=79690 RepID=UPI0028C43404|nr:mediator of RNA polymerase II transcription subunit 11 isoform X2 [Hypanus sabinus]